MVLSLILVLGLDGDNMPFSSHFLGHKLLLGRNRHFPEHYVCVYVPPAYSHFQQNVHNFIAHPFRVGVCSGGITCPGSSLHTSQRNEAQDVVTCLGDVWSGPLKSCGGGEWQTTSVLVVLVLNSPCLRVVFTNPLFIIELTKSTVAGTLHRPCTDMMSPDLSPLSRS